MEFVECFSQSAFSFREGASLPEELVQESVRLSLKGLGICDRGGVYGLVRAWKEAQQFQLPLLHGTLLSVEGLPDIGLIAENTVGWSSLCELISLAHSNGTKQNAHLLPGELWTHPDGLVALADWAWCAQPEALQTLVDCFPGAVTLVASRHYLPTDHAHLALIEKTSKRLNLPVVVSSRALQHTPDRQPLQDVLECIRNHCTLDTAGRTLKSNRERHLQSGEEMFRRFPHHPRWIQESLAIQERCQFHLGQLEYNYPKEVVPPGYTPMSWLRNRTRLGLMTRYPSGTPDAVQAQVNHELNLVEELNFPAYFLTVYDIVRMARERGILCQGRGSAANSAICYALGITSVDPARSHMLFERFISRERREPPDIDVDFEHGRREEVIQAIYEKYGRDRAAMINAVISYRPRSAIRDVGKALGLSLAQIGELSKRVDRWDKKGLRSEIIEEAGLDPQESRLQHCITLTQALQGFPRHVSIHSGGFVISEGSLRARAPIEPATMEQRTVIQWDKDDIDALGFVKLDCLALGMLTAIQKAFNLIELKHKRPLQLATVPAEDQAVYEMCTRGETMGVFQIESRAQMSMLPRLRPRCFYDLVIEVSIVRPGPIQGGMVHPYLNRRRGLEPIHYAHPDLQPILERTLGVPIFQEQVMEMASAVGGFSPGESDQLRRAMGAWRKKGGLEPLLTRLVANMERRGIEPHYAQQIADQILGFGEYGFPESHAASFALLVYVSAWLKHYYPAAFTTALLNSQPMGFYSPSSLVGEAKRQGVEVRPPCVLSSDWDSTLEEDGKHSPTSDGMDGRPARGVAIRLGFHQIKGMKQESADRLIAFRDRHPISDLTELHHRAGLSQAELRVLARADAFAELGWSRRDALWRIDGLWSGSLLRSLPPPTDSTEIPKASAYENLQLDFLNLGLCIQKHPIELGREWLNQHQVTPIAQLQKRPHGSKVSVAGLVTHRQRPQTASGVMFLGMEDETGITNIVVWPKIYERQRRLIRSEGLLLVRGTLQKEQEAISVVARSFEVLPLEGISAKSRDFR
ncbi:MAG: error-prone DNA polymerase [Myxococcota bacterium]|nr:error-prone DNA polymerase [Myxococcota bacterium]